MKIDFSRQLTDLHGEPWVEEGNPVTLSKLACNALLSALDGDRNMSGEQKFKLYTIATKVVDGGEQEISVEDVAVIKDRIGKAFGPLAVGRAWNALEGKE